MNILLTTIIFLLGISLHITFALSQNGGHHGPAESHQSVSMSDIVRQTRNKSNPLILTPLINSGRVAEARNLSKVSLGDTESYSGFLTVDPKYNSNIFFWFFPAKFNPDKAPVLLWLNGGPGSSSMLGLFVENGPFIIDSSNNIHFRSTSWSLTHSVIYVDSPVGTGFSFTDAEAGYAKSEETVANGLYSTLTQLFTLFPEYQAHKFFLTGESYAGKYIPHLAWKIHQENKLKPKVRINMKGMAIGDAYSDPENMLDYGEMLYTVGLLDANQKIEFQKEEDKIRASIRQKNWIEAFNGMDALLFGGFTSEPSLFKKSTGFEFYYNILINSQPTDFTYYTKFLDLPYVRQALHVGNASFNETSYIARQHMREVILQSAAPVISELLDAPEKYKILIYNGQLDICVATTLIESALSKLKWHGAKDYPQSEKKLWKVGKDLAGYVKVVDNFTFLVIRNAGHIVPYDQPKWSFDMINRFTSGKPFAK